MIPDQRPNPHKHLILEQMSRWAEYIVILSVSNNRL